MNPPNVFHGKPAFFQRSVHDSRLIEAIPAVLNSPAGEQVPGAAVFLGSRLLTTLTADGAYKLATNLADAIDHHKRTAALHRPTTTNAAFDVLADR